MTPSGDNILLRGSDRVLRALRLGERGRERARAFLVDPTNVAWILIALAVVAALQQYLLGPKMMGGGLYTHFNNYRIYERSFVHLLHGQDPYVAYPAEHWDFFKYSPTFALLMAPFHSLPDAVGIVLWNLLNAAIFVLALAKLPILSSRGKALLGLVLVPDFLTAVQNTQANVLIAGLLVLAFGLLEEDRPALAALAIVSGTFIKLYPALGGLLFFLYPRRARFLLWGAAWTFLLGALPLLVVSAGELRAFYESWFRLLFSDREVLTGLSVMGWLHGWFGFDPPKTWVVLVGAAIVLAPLAHVGRHGLPTFRLLFLASLLVWMVIFNHAAESATFFIAMTGVGLWYFARPRGQRSTVLFALALLFTSMSPRFPNAVVQAVVVPYVLKAVPCIFVWAVVMVELFWVGPRPREPLLAPT